MWGPQYTSNIIVYDIYAAFPQHIQPKNFFHPEHNTHWHNSEGLLREHWPKQ